MRVEICVPAYNEEAIIAESVKTLQGVLKQFSSNIVVVDNASRDETAARATDAGAAVLIVRTPGKGAAVITCAQGSDADVFGFIDADLSADPAHIPTFVRMISDGDYDVVIGSRLLDTSGVRRSMFRTVSSRAFNSFRKALLGIRVHDTQCGLKVMNARGRAVLALCEERGWFFDMEFLARAEKDGLKIREVPVHWDEHRFHGRKSKLRVRDGFGALLAMVRIRTRIMSQ